MIRRVAAAGVAVGIGVWFAFLLFGAPVIELIFGQEYRAAYPVMLTVMAAYVIYMGNLPLRPAVLSLGHSGRTLAIDAVATGVFLVCLVAGLQFGGLIGAAAAQVFLHASAAAMLWIYLRTCLKH